MKRSIFTPSRLIASICALLIVFVACDKFEELNFTTENQFDLDTSAHELSISTEQSTWINFMVLEGDTFRVRENITADKRDFGKFIVYYKKGQGYYLSEIVGEWFTVKCINTNTYSIYIAKNETDSSRDLTLVVSGFLTMEGEVRIHQRAGTAP